MSHALRSLFASAIDYAGLFPPAGLSMSEAARQHSTYVKSPHAWALGRFVLPAKRLAELESAATGMWNASHRWRISALVNSSAELSDCLAFNERQREVAVIDMIEVKATSAEELRAALIGVPATMMTYVEIPLAVAATLVPLLAAAQGAATQVCAKVRTGGLTAEGFPACQELAEFMEVCAKARLPFKATAGLHHPLRRVAAFTYEPGSASGTMHGFMNVFVAAAFLWHGWSAERVVPILEETATDGFHFDANGVAWRGQRLDNAALVGCRSDFIRSFGSCSFTEPITELTELGFLNSADVKGKLS